MNKLLLAATLLLSAPVSALDDDTCEKFKGMAGIAMQMRQDGSDLFELYHSVKNTNATGEVKELGLTIIMAASEYERLDDAHAVNELVNNFSENVYSLCTLTGI